MRITTRELNRSMLDVINNRYNDLADLQQQLATGKRLRRPSDDPVDVANDLQLTTKERELNQYKTNIEDSLSYMSISETSMESMNTLLQRLRELAIEGATDTLGPDERVYINKEVEQLTRQFVALVNTNYKGDYIFNGQQTKIPPLLFENSVSATVQDYTDLRMAYFNAFGQPVGTTVQLFNGFSNAPVADIIPGTFSLSVGGVTYNENTDYTIDYQAGTITILNPALAIDASPGTPQYAAGQTAISFDYLTRGRDIYGQTVSNRGIIERSVETGVSMQINIGMDEMTTDPVTGNTLLGTLVGFGQALVQNNQPGISNSIDQLDLLINSVLSAQSKSGARTNRLQTTLARNEGQATQVTSLRSELEDAEMAETASKFMLAQNVYNAALQSTAKIIQPSLVNFL
jgi:flagellar hook-associated protein 3 FlgL